MALLEVLVNYPPGRVHFLNFDYLTTLDEASNSLNVQSLVTVQLSLLKADDFNRHQSSQIVI